MNDVVLQKTVEQKIFILRGSKVMLDRDLAYLYGVTARALRQQVKRNRKRFPGDFMFRLTAKEADLMVSQNVTPSQKYFGGHLPYAFTEEGVAMLSSVLHSPRAVQVNIAIMRVFVRLRDVLSANKELAYKLKELEHKVEKHDEEIIAIFDAIRQLMTPSPEKPKPQIGFHT